MRDPNPESPERDNPDIPLGLTFFAQFIDHNLTLDITPLFAMQQDPAAVTDIRSSNLDLNAVVDYLLATDPQKYVGEGANPTLFRDASQTAHWHYQWIIVNEFLPKIIGAEVVQEVVTHGRLWYRPAEQGYQYPYMPVEFSTAAYRLGHAMLRQHYVINDGFQANLFDMPVFGNPRIDASKKLDFTKFFDFPGKPAAQRARRYGAIITPPVFELPFIDPIDDPPVVLPQRNMLRARLFKVPSGQEVATLMKNAGLNIVVHSNQALGITAIPGTDGLHGQAPLWY
jgi:hypothetical protein